MVGVSKRFGPGVNELGQRKRIWSRRGQKAKNPKCKRLKNALNSKNQGGPKWRGEKKENREKREKREK